MMSTKFDKSIWNYNLPTDERGGLRVERGRGLLIMWRESLSLLNNIYIVLQEQRWSDDAQKS